MKNLVKHFYNILEAGIKQFDFNEKDNVNKYIVQTADEAIVEPIKMSLPILLDVETKVGDRLICAYQPEKGENDRLVDVIIKDLKLISLEPNEDNSYTAEMINITTGDVYKYENFILKDPSDKDLGNLKNRIMFLKENEVITRVVPKDTKIEKLTDIYLGIFSGAIEKAEKNFDKAVIYVEDKPLKVLEFKNAKLILGSTGTIVEEQGNIYACRLIGLTGVYNRLRLDETNPFFFYLLSKENDNVKGLKLNLFNTKLGG